MSHDASKVAFGVPDSSDRVIVDFDADPASFPSGTVVRLKSDGTLSTAVADGAFFGVSMGKSQSETKRLSVCKSGNRVPMLLNKIAATGTITITSFANLINAGDDAIVIGGETFTAKASPSGANQFLAATSNAATRDALLAKIQAHPNLVGVVTAAASSTAAILLTAVTPGTAGNSIVLTYTDNGTSTVGATVSGSGHLSGGVAVSSYAAPGSAVYIDDVTGKVSQSSGSTISNAFCVSDELTGLYGDGTSAPAVLVDMGGGL
jgi:hypothetical protein